MLSSRLLIGTYASTSINVAILLSVLPWTHLSFDDDSSNLKEVTETKDLGILVDSSFKPLKHCIQAANKARNLLFLIRYSFENLTPEIFLPLYVTLVRPHLEYGIQASASYFIRDMDHLERVQRLATPMVRDLRDLPYELRLRRLNLNGHYDIPRDILFPPAPERGLRGHKRKLLHRHFRLNRRKEGGFFSIRISGSWNRLPEDVVNTPMPEQFKAKLDRRWSEIFPSV